MSATNLSVLNEPRAFISLLFTALVRCAETEGIIQHMTAELIYTSLWSGPVWAFLISLYSILPEFSLSVKSKLAFSYFARVLYTAVGSSHSLM